MGILVWADNADACSTQYAGTGALKTDFTRTGQRTKLGLLMDGKNSAIRYYKNNFCDGYRQDSMDFFLGNYEWNTLNRSPFQDSNEGQSYSNYSHCCLFNGYYWNYSSSK